MIPLPLFVAALVGWLQGDQQKVIEYLREENRVLKAQLQDQRLRLTDGAWLLVARLSVVGCWRKWRQSSRLTPFCTGTAS